MEPNEEATYEVIQDALALVLPGRGAEMLVADSSRAHFRRVLAIDRADAAATCQVGSPSECPAANAGQTQRFPDSEKLDACPYLRHRLDEPLAAVCVPVSIAGQTVAVLHTARLRADDAIGSETARELELVARKAGDRITVLRVLARTEAQAHVDMLTGLLNRRSLENQVHDLIQQDQSYVVLFADLDHFKDLNDVHGHEIGDRALRLFARVLRDSIRPNDIPARYGGEEFVIVLPDCTVGDACIVAERVQSRLVDAVSTALVPPFTVSVGVAAGMPQEAFGETVARADAALLHAKGAGRNRVVVDSDIPSPETAGSAVPESLGPAAS
jgi:diguanylate cyclase (GGDEF)-like protein